MSRSILDSRLCFVCEWFDDMANLTRELQLLYFYDDNSVELTELKTKSLFLRRIRCPGLGREQFFLGGNVMIFGRVMKLTKFGDEVTRQLCEESAEYTTLILAEALFAKLGSVLAVLVEERGFSVKTMSTCVLSATACSNARLSASFADKRAVVVQAVRRSAVSEGLSFAQRIGTSLVAAAPDSAAASAWQSLANEPTGAVLGESNSAIIVIKPHALQRQLGGEIIQLVLSRGLRLAAVRLASLSGHDSDHLLQPYKGVLTDYAATVQSIAGNSWVAQFVAGDGSASTDVMAEVRSVCGPFDPAIARVLAPKSIRGRFGEDRVLNAVHCTDVAEDATVYAEYFFSQ